MKRMIAIAVVLCACGKPKDKAEQRKEEKASDCKKVAARVAEILGDSSTTDKVEDLCVHNRISHGAQQCLLEEATKKEDLLEKCEASALRALIGEPLACPEGATQHAPDTGLDGLLETWCERDGKRHGPMAAYDDQGHEVYEQTYKDGVLDGTYIKGPLSGAFAAGKRQGTWTYDADGKSVSLDYVADVPEGEYREYDGDDQILDAHVHAGALDGKVSGWWTGGATKLEGAYAAGKRTGTWTIYWGDDPDHAGADPQPAAKGTYADGERADGWTFWDEHGKKIGEDDALAQDWLQPLLDADPRFDVFGG